MGKLIRGLMHFLFIGIFTICFPLASAELDSEAPVTREPNAHEVLLPVVHASEENVEFELPFKQLYAKAKKGKKLDFDIFAKSLNMEVRQMDGKDEHYAIIYRDNVTIFVFWNGNRLELSAYFLNDYGKVVEFGAFASAADAARAMYYLATRATIDLHELEKKDVEGADYLPLEFLYRVTTYGDAEMAFTDDGVLKIEELSREHSKNTIFYNLH